MNKTTWINILHFYQPATADNETVTEAAAKSYSRIVGALKRNPKIKFTLNLAGCLLEKLNNLGYGELLADLKFLHEKKQIELTGTAAYHPILPLLPEKEIIRQIKLNEEILKKYFGKKFKPAGFFPPELAYSQRLGRIIKSLNYSWILLDEISAAGELGQLDFNKQYFDKNSGLKICFRSRKFSRGYVPRDLFSLINSDQPGPAITATDAELYGLRHDDFSASFEKLLKRPEITTLTVSEFLPTLKEKVLIKPLASSWESTPEEIKKGLPFALWQNKNNKIQILLWQLADLAITTINANRADVNYAWARSHLDRGLTSCTFWWASARDFKLFGSISWSPDEIERGLNELVKSVRSLAGAKTKDQKIAAEKLYIKIKTLIWHKHWHYYWQP